MDSEQYLLTLMRYIKMNPVRAGMVINPQIIHGQVTIGGDPRRGSCPPMLMDEAQVAPVREFLLVGQTLSVSLLGRAQRPAHGAESAIRTRGYSAMTTCRPRCGF